MTTTRATTRTSASTNGPRGSRLDATTGFTDDERAAMQERNRELKAGRTARDRADGERDLLAKIAEMPDGDRALAERLHALITGCAPGLSPKTWYGMPAYAKDGTVLCFFQAAAKFKSRYATLGFSDKAVLDDGSFWPTSYALTGLGEAEEAQIRALVTRAAAD